ncbi:MAG: metallophosphatase family protein [Bacteroidales bacterium]|jgi:putative phosphoesterase|nr:metallophosphatase family protein [Bacteroidales bacterium]
MKYAIFSDIHSNLTALQACYEHFLALNTPAKIVILGDYIDYGPRPNETVEYIQNMSPHIVLCGNHEKALNGGEDSKFSSPRGVTSSRLTRQVLDVSSMKFIDKNNNAFIEHDNILFIHGDLSNPYWGKMSYSEMQDTKYRKYDFVISGHTHIPHLLEIFYETENLNMRNKKKTIFLNPGSVGQPRNHCPNAQYMVMDTETEEFNYYKVPYDIKLEQSFFTEEFDVFYKNRLIFGV